MRTNAKGHVDPQHGGWVAWTDDEFPGAAWVRFEDHDGRLVPVDFLVAVDDGVTANLLRRVPLGWLEAQVNGSALAKRVRSGLARPAPDVRSGLPRPRRRKEAEDALLGEISLILEPSRPGLDHGDDFYRRVAEAYEALNRVTRAPSTTIAEMRGVPVSTAKRWIREARARGFLPPARAGKAG